ncbi:MAG: hypothetical protein LBB74_00960 [Chitinispirillales bacterium]|jgi:hypothetical protein|nr:hypothetical protein [Chitinispirillales bacterium]
MMATLALLGMGCILSMLFFAARDVDLRRFCFALFPLDAPPPPHSSYCSNSALSVRFIHYIKLSFLLTAIRQREGRIPLGAAFRFACHRILSINVYRFSFRFSLRANTPAALPPSRPYIFHLTFNQKGVAV